MTGIMKPPEFILFASDAKIAAVVAGVLLLVSLAALLGDHRRRYRADIDKVGLLPWRDIGAISLFAGLILLAFAISGLLQA